MTAPALLAEVAAAGGRIEARGDRLRLGAPAPLPADLVERVRAEKPALLAILAAAADWRARHAEALAHYGALHPANEAARIAWGEMVNRWHKLYGERVAEWTDLPPEEWTPDFASACSGVMEPMAEWIR